jgi:hypothetical protein
MQINIHHIGVAALALLAASPAYSDIYRIKMTGTQLVRDMLSDPLMADNAVMRERAMGYIDGITDVTVGVYWCPAKKTVPHELNYVVAEEMKGLGANRLKGDAAPLVLATLRKHYPCTVAGTQL